eukprot:TRINITY_DN1813_c0_g1_i5.p3 TRINITY_DN1813_c0_g1~~TRINITY_DN1813_c0_g1_i5.p3  ORF type:complete len:113 (-),score=17.44 TRINITY_DN1813_c0_g1_i5:22-360(-)
MATYGGARRSILGSSSPCCGENVVSSLVSSNAPAGATESDDGRSPWEVLLHRCRAVANEENKRMPWDRAAAMAEVLARQGQHACLTQALLKGSYGSFLFVSDQIWTSKMVRK